MKKLLIISIFVSLTFLAADKAQAANCQGSQNAADCQYMVDYASTAPQPSVSAGIRQNHGIDGVLYDNTSAYGICRYLDNHSGSHLFVPQGSQKDFTAFVKNPPSGAVLAPCVFPSTITAKPSEAAQYEIDSENGMIVNAIGVVPDITNIPIPATRGIVRYLDPTQILVVKTDVNGNPLAFTYMRSDCETVNGHKECRPWYVKEVQTIFLTPSVQNGKIGDASLSFSWGNPTVVSAWFKSNGKTGPWERIAGPNRHYDPPVLCKPGYLPGTTWSVTSSEAFSCPTGDTGAYTQTTIVPYTCGADGQALTGTPVITDNQSTACMPLVDGVCGAAAGVPLASAPTSDLCSTPYPASAVTLISVPGNPAAHEWNWTCPGSANGGKVASCSALQVTTPPIATAPVYTPPFGLYEIPQDQMGTFNFNMTAYYLRAPKDTPASLIALLDAARLHKMHLILSLVNFAQLEETPLGNFSLDNWKERYNYWCPQGQCVDLRSYVQDGTLMAVDLFEYNSEPTSTERVTPTLAQIKQVAQYVKSLWPYLPTMIDTSHPCALKAQTWSGADLNLVLISLYTDKRTSDQDDRLLNEGVACAKQANLGYLFNPNPFVGGTETVSSNGLPSYRHTAEYALMYPGKTAVITWRWWPDSQVITANGKTFANFWSETANPGVTAMMQEVEACAADPTPLHCPYGLPSQ